MKKKLTIGLLAMVAFLSTVSVKAQTVDEIINKHIAAMGGKEKLLSLKTVKKTGSINTEGLDVGVVVTIVQGVGSRNDISVPNMGEGYQITNANKGWNFLPFQGQSSPEEVQEKQLKSSQYLLDLQGMLVNYKEKGSQVELLGTEKVDSADCYKLKITTKAGNEATVFINGNNWYNVKTISKTAEEEITTVYSDFKKNSEGYIFPFAQSISRGTIVFNTIETNIPVDEKIFTIN